MTLILTALIILVFSYFGLPHILGNYFWFESFGYSWVYVRTLMYQCLSTLTPIAICFLAFLINQWVINRIEEKSTSNHTPPITHPLLQKLKLFISLFFGNFPIAFQSISNAITRLLYLGLSVLIGQAFGRYWVPIAASFFTNAFSITDPIFKKDVSFYVFQLPVLNTALAFLTVILLCLILVSLWQYAKRRCLPLTFSPTFRHVRGHLFTLAAVFFMIQAVRSFLSKYQILFNHNDIIFGAGFTDATVYLPIIGFMPILWLAMAALALAFIARPKLKPLLIGTMAIIAFQFVGLTMMPRVIQQLVVSPNEFKKETQYIQHNIEFTQRAYGLKGMTEVAINYKKEPSSFNTTDFHTTLQNVRLWNPEPLKSTLKQLQEIRLYYEFKSVDVDRYLINNTPQQVMLSVRELDVNQMSSKAQTWINKRLMFTHGYGLCMVPVNQFNSEGLPELMIRDIPPVSHSDIHIQQPEVYFGEATNHYVIANTKQKEFDYPKDNENRYTHYTGSGGIQLNSFFKRLLYAIRLNDFKLLISQNIHSKSRLMMDRNVHVIPKKITPFITYDTDPYIVVSSNGRLIWMVDGYTLSEKFPYSTPYSSRINYIRNSVVATIDAYSGKTMFYMKDPNDPIIKAYAAMYPDLFLPVDNMPSDLAAHLRYPKELFKVVTKVYNTYHMTDPQVFYNKEDVWTFPTETYDSEMGITMDPYYMYIQYPVSKTFEYAIMLPLTPSNKNNLVAILMASCEPESFGKLTVVKLPKQETVYGPLQIESRIDQNTEISKDLTLWGQVGSRVIRGNMMVIPYQESILYIEPIYLQATQSKLPELKRVIVAFGDQVIMAPSIIEGIASLTNDTPQTFPQLTVTDSPSKENELTKKITDAFFKVKETLRQADWVSFGRAFERLDGLINQLKKEE